VTATEPGASRSITGTISLISNLSHIFPKPSENSL
jgi:hypothetical protein